MKIVLVAAIGRNNVIGRDGQLPWRLKSDLKHFRALTIGKPVVMGRKTYESIGRPLPGRTTIVLSRSGFTAAPGVLVARDWQEATRLVPELTLYLAGGAALYAEALPWCTELLLTHVDLEPAADAFFPDWSKNFDSGEVLQTHPTCVMKRHRPLPRA